MGVVRFEIDGAVVVGLLGEVLHKASFQELEPLLFHHLFPSDLVPLCVVSRFSTADCLDEPLSDGHDGVEVAIGHR